jgi:membrane protein YdbS with pleckstrin-like domain
MQKDNRRIKPKQIIELVLVVIFYIFVIGGFIWSMSGSSEIAQHSRSEFKQGLLVLFGLIILISIMVSIYRWHSWLLEGIEERSRLG